MAFVHESPTIEYSSTSRTKLDEHYRLSRPSKELLYYRRKIMQMVKGVNEMEAKVEKLVDICEEQNQIRLDNQRRQSEVHQLQETVSDLQVHLYQEREHALRLYAENDRLKIRSLQDRKKINYLLSLTSTSEKELNLICTKPWKSFVAPKISSALPKQSKASVDSEQSLSAVDVDTLILQNKALTSQLEDQTRLFQDNFHTLLKDRELQRQEASVQFEQSQEKIARLSSQLTETKRELCNSMKEMLSLKEESLKAELQWMAERDIYSTSAQKSHLHNASFDNNIKGDGQSYRGDKKSMICEVRSLKDELNQRDSVIAMYQSQCGLLEEQTSSLIKQLETCKVQCKNRIEKLIQHITALKKKYNELDQRRRFDADGFRSDVQILRTRLRDVERTVVKLNRTSSMCIDQDVIASAADTASKAKLLGHELLVIKQKMAEMDSKLTS